MKPTAGFDLSPLCWAPPSGISYYTFHLAEELERLDLPFVPCYFVFSHRPFALDAPAPETARLKRAFLPMRAAKTVWDFGWGQKLLGLSNIDLFFATNSELPALSKNQKKVMVLHDLSSLRLDGVYSGSFRARRLDTVRQGLERADRLVVYSQSTRVDLCELFSYPKENCKIIPLGVDNDFFSRKTSERPFTRPYFFSNGMLQPRKNFSALARAFLTAVEEAELPHQLLIAGGDGWRSEEIKAEIRLLDKDNRIQFLGYVPRPKLGALYQHADAFLFPSLYEGFGLPVLEAMAAGTPVLTSNTSALPEVAGDAALLVNPSDFTEIKEGILRLATDRQLSERLRQEGRKRAAGFSFAQTARQTAGLISELLGLGAAALQPKEGER